LQTHIGHRRRRNHSALMPALRTTLPHFAVSLTTNLSRLAGETVNAVPPKSVSRAMILRSASDALIFLLSLSMISGGVFLGAPIAIQEFASKFGRKSPSVGMFGNAGECDAVVAARARNLSALICSMDPDRLSKATCICGQMQKIAAGRFHGLSPKMSEPHLMSSSMDMTAACTFCASTKSAQRRLTGGGMPELNQS
jgi:hypothetical protein